MREPRWKGLVAMRRMLPGLLLMSPAVLPASALPVSGLWIGTGKVQLAEKAPQAVNLSAWPTSSLPGRDGRVRFVETGFSFARGAAFCSEAKQRYAENIEHLLASRAGKATR